MTSDGMVSLKADELLKVREAALRLALEFMRQKMDHDQIDKIPTASIVTTVAERFEKYLTR